MNEINTVLYQLQRVTKELDQLKEEENELRTKLLNLMQEKKLYHISLSDAHVKFYPSSTKRAIDREALGLLYPNVFRDKEIWKTSTVKPMLRIWFKKG